MSKEHNSSYVMNEEVFHAEKQKNIHTEHDSWEVLQAYHHNVSHLDEMIKKVNSMEKNTVKNTDTVNILNTLLQKSKLGGVNGGEENKAYFTRHGDHIVLVLNTVVNGKKLSSIGDIKEILTNVDSFLTKNPLAKQSWVEKKETPVSEALQQVSKRLVGHDRRIQEVNASYRENINDWFMLRDAVVDTLWGESGKEIFGKNIRSIQKEIEKDHRTFLQSLSGKEISPEDTQKLNTYQKHVEELLGRKLEDVQSFAGYLVKEKKIDSAINVGHAMKGMTAWAFEAFTGTVVFLFLCTTNSELRENIQSSVGGFYQYLKENCSNPEVLWGDFLKMIDKEFSKMQGLPPEKQAEAIGSITGNIMATIIGAKGMNALMKSGKLRLKFKIPDIEIPPAIQNWKKLIKDIGEVKNWADMENFVSTIDRVRFKEGLTGKMIQETINEVRQWTKKISQVPDHGGLRATVKKLIENGGIVPELAGIEQKSLHALDQITKKWITKAKEILPFKEARQVLNKKILTGYDHIDLGITKLRTLTNAKIAILGEGLIQASHIRELQKLTTELIRDIKQVSFVEKDMLLDALETLENSLKNLKEKWGNLMTSIDESITLEGNLTKKEFQNLRFEEGFAIHEKKNASGVSIYEYRDIKGEKFFSEYTYASNFKDDKAFVTTLDGRHITIDRSGVEVLEHTEAFSSIQRFKDGGYRVFKDGQYQIMHPEGYGKHESVRYPFMTEIHGEMVIAVDSDNVKYIINQENKRFLAPFHYIDDFSEHGVAAVQDKINGKWLLIDTEGKLIMKDGTRIWGTGEMIDADGKVMNQLGNRNGVQRFNQKKATEARNAAFEQDWYDTNLEAIKSHIDKNSWLKTPEMIHKIESDAIVLLRKHNIDTRNPLFSHAQKDGILLYHDSAKKGTQIINLLEGTVSKESFSYIHTPDLDHGFIRVSPLSDGEHMGVVDLKGNYIIEPKYTDIQVHDEAKKLFEVSEMRTIGDTLEGGSTIQRHHLDVLGSEVVERIGLVDGTGKTLIPTAYTEIAKTNDLTSKGLMRWEDYAIISESKGYHAEKYSGDNNMYNSRDYTASLIALTTSEVPMSGRAGGKAMNSLQEETSTILQDLRSSPLSGFTNRKTGTEISLSSHMQTFLHTKVAMIRDIGTLETAIRQMVHEETREAVRAYLEQNKLRKLSKGERLAVAEYEKETRENIIREIRTQIQEEKSPSKNGNPAIKGGFAHTLATNLHPDFYRSIG